MGAILLKRFVKLAAVAALCLLLAACGGSSPASADTSAAGPAGAASSSEAAAPSASESAQASAAQAPPAGTWQGNVYTNTWTGLTFTLPKGWRPLTAEEIGKVLGAGANYLSDAVPGLDGETYSAFIGNTDYYDFYTASSDGMASFFLDVYDPVAAGVPGVTAEQYLQSVSQLLSSVKGLKVEAGQIEDDEFCGHPCKSLNLTMSAADGSTSPATQAYSVFQCGHYLLCYCASAKTSDTASQVLELLNSCKSIG